MGVEKIQSGGGDGSRVAGLAPHGLPGMPNMSMRFHILQHVPFEGAGSIAPWLKSQGAIISATRFFESPLLPEVNAIDALLVLGGPMSVNDEKNFSWLRDEKYFVGEAIHAGMPVLGICLGAQIMAAALGARVYANPGREIGWFPIYGCSDAPEHFNFPRVGEAFHWHGDTFDLPSGAVHLARSEGCLHQAFQVGPCAMGLQFHLEATPESVDAIIAHGRHELVPDRFVQSEQALRSVDGNRYVEINQRMDCVLRYITRSRAR